MSSQVFPVRPGLQLLLALLVLFASASCAHALPGPTAVTVPGQVLAQQPAPAPPNAPGSTVVAPTRSLFWEYVIILLLVGAALFAVCRSSQRA